MTLTGSTFGSVITGSPAAVGHQLAVDGDLTLTGATLNVLGTGAGVALGQSIRLIDNRGANPVTGTFTGLAQGATLTVEGQTFTLSYIGGTGNDVVLTATSIPPIVPPVVPPVVPPLMTAPASPRSITPQFSIGLDRGSGVARLVNQNQSPRFEFTLVPGFTGGVRTASGDFNGDGIADLVIGTGPGISSKVVVLNGVDQSVLFTINPFEEAFVGGVFVTVGDITNDGVPDLAISPDESGGPRVRIFNGSDFKQLADYFGIDDPAFRGGARVSMGDINGDGRAEVVVAAGFGGGPRITIWDGAGVLAANNGNVPNSVSIANFFAFETALRNGSYIAAGDINGDGKADVAFGGGPGGAPRVRIFDGPGLLGGGYGNLDEISSRQLANFFSGDVNDRAGVRLAVKNIDNDRFGDLLTGGGPDSDSRVRGYAGKSITSSTAEILNLEAAPGFRGGIYVG